MQPGTIIGQRYRLEKHIGAGAIGDVYAGVDVRTQTPVAIKALKTTVVQKSPKLLERFRREALALRDLDHPNIVRIYAALAVEGRYFLVMEYVPGGSLRDVLRREGPLPLERALPVALDLCDALTRAHRLQIVHRDLKPANVLLAADGTPKLTDFGAARVETAGALTGKGGVIGTVAYLSPEACRGEVVDLRTDVWAFGIMLWEMLVGARPFDRAEPLATALAIMRAPLPDLTDLLPDAPPRLLSLIYQMLEKDRERRASSMRQVGAEIEAILHNRQTAPGAARSSLDLMLRKLEEDDADPAQSRLRALADQFGSGRGLVRDDTRDDPPGDASTQARGSEDEAS